MVIFPLGALAVLSVAPALYWWRSAPRNIVCPLSIVGGSMLLYGVIGTILAGTDMTAMLIGEQAANVLPFALWLFVAGYLGFATGYLLPPRAVPLRTPAPIWPKTRVDLGIVLLAGIAWGVRLYAASKGIAIPRYVIDGGAGLSAIYLIPNPIVLTLFLRANVLSWAAIALCFVAHLRRSKTHTSVGTNRWAYMGVALGLLEVLYFAGITLSNAPIIGLALVVFTVVTLAGRPPIKLAVSFAIIFALVVMPFVARVKGVYASGLGGGGLSQLLVLVTEILPQAAGDVIGGEVVPFQDYLGHSTRLSALDYAAFLVEAEEVRGIPPAGAAPLIGALFGLVPRLIWPGKPLAFVATSDLKDHFGILGYDPANANDVVVSPLAELYAFLGPLGTIVGMFVLGLLARAVYHFLVERHDARWNSGIVIYSTLAYELFFVERGVVGGIAPLRDAVLLWVFLTVVVDGGLSTSGAKSASLQTRTRLRQFEAVKGHAKS